MTKYYIGIDVGGTNLVAGLVDREGRILRKAGRPVDKTLGDQALCRQLVQLALEVCRAEEVPADRVQAVGVGIPGLVDNRTGTVIRTPNMPFRETPARRLFQEEWDVPFFLGNDANCAAIGEYWAGSAKGCDPVVMVTLGTGIGGGMVAGGKLFTGFANSAMEIGHMIVRPGGTVCGCGNRGCWEQYGSATALIRMTRQEMERDRSSALWRLCGGDLNRVQGVTPFQGARQGDETALHILDIYRRDLAVGLINLINLLQPQVICMGGGVSNADDDLLLEPLRVLVKEGIFDKEKMPRLERASLGNDAGVVGAAMLCDMV